MIFKTCDILFELNQVRGKIFADDSKKAFFLLSLQYFFCSLNYLDLRSLSSFLIYDVNLKFLQTTASLNHWSRIVKLKQ